MDDRTHVGRRVSVGNLEEPSTAKLLEAALKESRELIRIELDLAKLEAKKQLKDTAKAAVGFVVAAFLALTAVVLLVVALVIALGGTAGAAFGVAIGALALAGARAFISRGWLPTKPLAHSRRHVSDDLRQLREHVV